MKCIQCPVIFTIMASAHWFNLDFLVMKGRVDEKPLDEKPLDEKPVDEKPVGENPHIPETNNGCNGARAGDG